MFRKLSLFLIVIFMCFPLVNADTKPIAAKVVFNDGIIQPIIDLYVEIDHDDFGNIICKVKNKINVGSSAFTTNLGNLVYNDFSYVPCNDLWSTGDLIWYEINYDEKTFISEKEKIKSGTGLQMLKSLTIDSPKSDRYTDESPSGNSGGNSGFSKKTIKNPTNLSENKELVNEGIIITSLELIGDILKINNKFNLKYFLFDDIEIKHVIYSFPSEEIIKIFVDNNILDGEQIIKGYSIADLKPGRYKLRSFVYSSEEIVTVSEAVIFNIDGEKLPVIKEKVEEHITKPISLEEKTLEKIPVWVLISITLALMATFLFLSKSLKKN